MSILVSFHAVPLEVSALLRVSAHFWDLMEATISLISAVRRLLVVLASGFPSLWCCLLRSFLVWILLLRLSGSFSVCPACLLTYDVLSSVTRKTAWARSSAARSSCSIVWEPSGLGGVRTPLF